MNCVANGMKKTRFVRNVGAITMGVMAWTAIIVYFAETVWRRMKVMYAVPAVVVRIVTKSAIVQTVEHVSKMKTAMNFTVCYFALTVLMMRDLFAKAVMSL